MSRHSKRDTHLTEMARVSPVVSLDPPHRHFRSPRHASVSAGTELAPAVDDQQEPSRAASRRALTCASGTLADRLLRKSAPPATDGAIAGGVVEQRQSRSRRREAGVDETPVSLLVFPSICFALWVSSLSATGRRPAVGCFVGVPPGLLEEGESAASRRTPLSR